MCRKDKCLKGQQGNGDRSDLCFKLVALSAQLMLDYRGAKVEADKLVRMVLWISR